MGFQNRLMRHKLVGKLVVIQKGYFKGQRGRVLNINGLEAIIELITCQKKISVPKDIITSDIRDDWKDRSNGQAYDASAYEGQAAPQMGGRTPLPPYDGQPYGGQTPSADRNWGGGGHSPTAWGGKTAPYCPKQEAGADWGVQEDAKS